MSDQARWAFSATISIRPLRRASPRSRRPEGHLPRRLRRPDRPRPRRRRAAGPRPASRPSTALSRNTLQLNNTTPYTAPTDLQLRSNVGSGNLTLRCSDAAGKTFNFKKLYVANNLILTDAVRVNAESLYVGGTLTITNATGTTVTDTLGPLYVNGTGTSSVTGARVSLGTTSAYVRGPFTISNTSTTIAASHDLGDLYAVGALNLTGNVAVQTDSLYAGSTATISNTTTAAVTDNLGALHAVGALSVADRVAINTTSLRARSTATISNSTTTARTHFLGALYAEGALDVTGNVTLSTTSLYAGSTATDRQHHDHRRHRQPGGPLRGRYPECVGQRGEERDLRLRGRRRHVHRPHLGDHHAHVRARVRERLRQDPQVLEQRADQGHGCGLVREFHNQRRRRRPSRTGSVRSS